MSKMEKRGFTLIELLVVIAIIGILSAVVLTSLNASREKARDANKVSDIKQIALAMELTRNATTGNYTIVSATMPTAIGSALASVPTNNDTDAVATGAYEWSDNTTASSSFCVWATLEDTTLGNFFVANGTGAGYATTQPSGLSSSTCATSG